PPARMLARVILEVGLLALRLGPALHGAFGVPGHDLLAERVLTGLQSAGLRQGQRAHDLFAQLPRIALEAGELPMVGRLSDRYANGECPASEVGGIGTQELERIEGA